MSPTIEQWIKRRSSAAVANGLGEWLEARTTKFGMPIYGVTDGPVFIVLFELGLSYDGPPTSFECRYDQVEELGLARLPEVLPRDGDLLPRSAHSRLLTLSLTKFGDQQPFEMQFTLPVYNQVASVLPRIVNELARGGLGAP